MKSVAVLFARADSIYKTMPECDVYDIERDARSFAGNMPVVAHPPCRGWGRLRQFSLATDEERSLGLLAVDWVRTYGGVLEHPAESTLFMHAGLPLPGRSPDSFRGWTFAIRQCDWGHRAEKMTWLYVCGISPDDLPEFPTPKEATHCIRPTKSYPRLPSVTKREREATPPALARWLVDLAMKTIART